MTRLLAHVAPGTTHRLALDALHAWGVALGQLLPLGAIVTLDGDLGAGKTTLARAIAEGAGVRDLHAVTSPTFAIIQQYDAVRGTFVHADLYRLSGNSALDALGWDELVDGAALTLVEWPGRVTRPWPSGTLEIRLAMDGPDARTLVCDLH